jgi:hypothetical protein
MTPTPAAEEPIDPAVRSLLWRLRARLVTPPEQNRTSDDLDRLFAAAREHAHGPELAPEVIRIIPPVTAGDGLSISATGTGVDHTVEVGQEDVAPVPAGITPIQSRRYRLTTMVSRVAAAAVLVVAVGGGFASARDGNGLTIQALLGRGASEPIESDTLANGSTGEVADDPDFDASDLREPRGVPLADDDDSVEVADDPDEDALTPDPRDDDEPSDDVSNEPASDPDQGTDGSSSNDAPQNAPVEEPSDEVIAAPAPAPAPSAPADPPSAPEQPSAEVVDEPASELVGAGGPIPCREDESLTDCFERREAAEKPADEAPVEDEDAGDATSGTDDDAAAREALAKRRGG